MIHAPITVCQLKGRSAFVVENLEHTELTLNHVRGAEKHEQIRRRIFNATENVWVAKT